MGRGSHPCLWVPSGEVFLSITPRVLDISTYSYKLASTYYSPPPKIYLENRLVPTGLGGYIPRMRDYPFLPWAGQRVATPAEKEARAERGRVRNLARYHARKAADPLGEFFRGVKARHGLTREMWEAFWERQAGRCAVCLDPLPQPPHGKSCVDHCHKSGRIRGILCYRCNVGLGHFRDSRTFLTRAYKYLLINSF